MSELKPSSSTIGGALLEAKGFFMEEFSKKKEELEKIIAELETRLAPVLKKVQAGEERVLVGATSILRNSEDSPLFSAVQDLKEEAHAAHDHYEVIRNKISGLIDRLHLGDS